MVDITQETRWRIQGGQPGVCPSPKDQDTKKYQRIYEDLDGGFVGNSQVLMLIYLVFLLIFRNFLNILKKNLLKSWKNSQKFSFALCAGQFGGKFLT